LPGLKERAKKANGSRQVSKSVQPRDLSHITRSYILIDFYKLTLRKYRFRGEVTEWNTDRMAAQIAEQLRYDRASASLYRSTKRLEARGLIRRMFKGGLQLTEQGIRVARSLSREPRIRLRTHAASRVEQGDRRGRRLAGAVRTCGLASPDKVFHAQRSPILRLGYCKTGQQKIYLIGNPLGFSGY
jgi:DNA-binding MarR family transcriptional regulator